jgi:hypothetical protein
MVYFPAACLAAISALLVALSGAPASAMAKVLAGPLAGAPEPGASELGPSEPDSPHSGLCPGGAAAGLRPGWPERCSAWRLLDHALSRTNADQISKSRNTSDTPTAQANTTAFLSRKSSKF